MPKDLLIEKENSAIVQMLADSLQHKTDKQFYQYMNAVKLKRELKIISGP